MNPKWRRLAPIGLIIALLAALAAAGLYIVQREWNLALQINLALIVVGLALFVLFDPDRTRRGLSGRQARYGSNALILTVAFIGILVVVNYLVFQNSQRWDMTEDKEFTLAPETLETLSSVPEPVQAVAFFTPRMNSEQAKSLLEEYKFNGQGNFDYEFIDPESNPVMAEEAEITRDGSVVLYMGGNKEIVTSMTEQELTGGLVRLMNPEERVIYFLTGHGEYSPDDTGDESYATAKRLLVSKNYTVRMLNLLAENRIPDDARVIVIAGPRQPISLAELSLLDNFLTQGGSLVVMEEPVPVTDFGESPDPLQSYLGDTWGIELGNDIVVDLTSSQPFAPYAAQYGNHAITQSLQRVTSQYPSVRSVWAGTAVDGVSQVELVLTAQQSWAETNLVGLANNEEIAFTEGEDISGPIPLAVVAENFGAQSRLAVFGDSDFAADANIIAYANSDVFVNTIDWVVGQEELISLTPKDTTPRTVIPPQASAMNLVLLVSVFVLPGMALIGGVVVFIQRRRRG